LEQFVFEVTYGCNAACVFCYNCWKAGPYPRGPLMTPGQYERVVDGLPKARMHAMSGGEPLMRPDILEVADAIMGSGRPSSLITNGLALDERIANGIAERRLGVQLPIHGPGGLHDLTMGVPGAFRGLVKAVILLRERGVPFSSSTVVSRMNIDSLEETLELSVALGSRSLLLIRFLPGGAGLERHDLLLARAEVERAYGILDRVCSHYGVTGAVGVPNLPCVIDEGQFRHVDFPSCGAGRSWYVIDPSGGLRMCNHSPAVYGNVLERAFEEILKHPTLQRFSRSEVHPAACSGCPRVASCRGGCRAAAETMHGDLCGPDPLYTA
jgi:radical SAM protein with 4Fe4S-binding SPASM domain